MAYNKIMKIAVLGHGLEGNAIESYFKDIFLTISQINSPFLIISRIPKSQVLNLKNTT